MSTLRAKSNFYLALALAVLLAASLAPIMLSHALSNAGTLSLNRSLIKRGNLGSENTGQAETFFRQAIAYSQGNRSAWIGLGIAKMAQGKENEAIEAWKNAEDLTANFMERGRYNQETRRYEEAIKWYSWATRLQPELADAWHLLGLAYESLELWENALQAHNRAINVGFFKDVGRSSPYYHLGVIYQWRLVPPQLASAKALYEAALAIDDFSTNSEAADTYYRLGEILRWMGREPNAYAEFYRQAIKLDPDHAFARVYLGMAIYLENKDVALAEANILRAIALDPQNKWAYFHLGEIYRKEGRATEALGMYHSAIEVDPEFKLAIESWGLLIEGD